MVSKLLVTVLALCLLALVSKVWGAPLPRYGTFVYSSLCGDPVGDIGGYSLTLRRTPKGDELDYTYGAGPLFGSSVRDLKVRSDHLTARVLTGEGEQLRLSATLGDHEAIVIEEPDPPVAVRDGPQHLPRVPRVPKRFPDCR